MKDKTSGSSSKAGTKKQGFEEAPDADENGEPRPSPGQLTTMQIREMMANAQRIIEERKKALSNIPTILPPAPQQLSMAPNPQPPGLPPLMPVPPSFPSVSQVLQNLRAQKRDQIQKTQLQSRFGEGPAMPKEPVQQLILDEHGRTLDLSGKEVTLVQHMPELKANIRAKKREQFTKKLHDKSGESSAEAAFYDSRIGARNPLRQHRGFHFHEKGKFQQMAAQMRMKAQLERVQSEIAQLARKTGISSSAGLATITMKKGEQAKVLDIIPDVEWWDTRILTAQQYPDEKSSSSVKVEAITNLIEHPVTLRPPGEKDEIVALPVFLTKEERKKVRRQNRRETWKDKQEKIRLGLEPPPEPKMRMSNLMRVLGTQAVQDPTKMEAHVRAQMAKRQKAHMEANAARKLTAEQRREKRAKKLQDDTGSGIHVSIYRVKDLSNPAKKFKVEMNAKQLYMTGCVLLFKDTNIVVVEGGSKQQKKFQRLMLHRIRWAEDVPKASKGDTGEDPQSNINRCILVWQGTVKERNFHDFNFKACPMESFAREHFKKHNVEHYWDLAMKESFLEYSDSV